VQVVTSSDVESLVGHEQQKQMLGCEENASCIAELAGALGVDKLCTGSLGKVEDTLVLSLRVIDVATSKVDSRLYELESRKAAFIGRMPQFVRQLFPGQSAKLPPLPVVERQPEHAPEKKPEPVVEKQPEPVVEKQPEPAVEKPAAPVELVGPPFPLPEPKPSESPSGKPAVKTAEAKPGEGDVKTAAVDPPKAEEKPKVAAGALNPLIPPREQRWPAKASKWLEKPPVWAALGGVLLLGGLAAYDSNASRNPGASLLLFSGTMAGAASLGLCWCPWAEGPVEQRRVVASPSSPAGLPK
jgi:hypothetical protein